MDVTKFGSGYQYGPIPGENYFSQIASQDILTKYQHDSQRVAVPITTGTSVIGMAYNNGVIIAADKLVSYGSLARFRNCDRIIKINDKTVLGCGGDYADFQYIRSIIDKRIIKDLELKDNNELKPSALFNWMTRYLYNRRCDMNPLYIDLIIGGINNPNEPEEKPFLGHVSIRGKAYRGDVIVTGFGSYLATPVLREFLKQKKHNIKDITKEEAQAIVKKSMEVLYYRDCRAYPHYSEGTVVRDNNNASFALDEKLVDERWDVAKIIVGY